MMVVVVVVVVVGLLSIVKSYRLIPRLRGSRGM
jgi:hypothetical protein